MIVLALFGHNLSCWGGYADLGCMCIDGQTATCDWPARQACMAAYDSQRQAYNGANLMSWPSSAVPDSDCAHRLSPQCMCCCASPACAYDCEQACHSLHVLWHRHSDFVMGPRTSTGSRLSSEVPAGTWRSMTSRKARTSGCSSCTARLCPTSSTQPQMSCWCPACLSPAG